MDEYNAQSNCAGWGRRNGDGSIELFDAKGNRVGDERDGRIILTDPDRLGGKEGRR